jgi:hypothetical protein
MGGDARVKDNIIIDAPLIPFGPAVLELHGCVVASRLTGIERFIPGFVVDGVLVADGRSTAAACLQLPDYSFLRLRIIRDDGSAHVDDVVGLASSYVTMEVPVNSEGFQDFFVPPGPVAAYVCGDRDSSVHVTVEEGCEDAGEVLLRRS